MLDFGARISNGHVDAPLHEVKFMSLGSFAVAQIRKIPYINMCPAWTG
jgi:hypothetical protein